MPWEDTDFTEDEMKLAEHARHLRGGDGRYGVHEISEDPEEVVRLGSSDMVVLIKPRSTQLLRFIERKATATAAMGFYRTDRYAASVSLRDLADALGTTIPELKSGWFRASKKERATLIKLFDLPDLPARRH